MTRVCLGVHTLSWSLILLDKLNNVICPFLQGLVKAINTAVDLIVAHFGTSRDAGVKVLYYI